MQDQSDWLRTRAVVTMLYRVNAKKGDRKKDKDIMPLPIDGLFFTNEHMSTPSKFQTALKKLGLNKVKKIGMNGNNS